MGDQGTMVPMRKNTILLALLGALTACSGTSLRCGTDGQSSYVDLVNVPQDLSNATRNFRELCSFAYEGDE